MSWKKIIKISENEKDDFKRYGQPEWDEGMKNIKDNKMERRVATFLDRIGDEKFQRQYLGFKDDDKELVDKLLEDDEETIKRATEATLDLAAAKGMDLFAAADLVAKTLGEQIRVIPFYSFR